MKIASSGDYKIIRLKNKKKKRKEVKREQKASMKRRDNKRRKARRGERRVVNVRTSIGFPDSEVAKIRYSDQITVTGTTYAQYTFRGNSVFDPDESGIGHQPMYFDQYAAVYSKYKVTASSCKVTVANYNATAAVVAVLVPSSEIVTITSYAIAMEQPYAKRTELIPISTRQGVKSTVKSTMTTQRMLGLTKAQLADDDYSASTGSSPISLWYWNIAFLDDNAVGVHILVDLEYSVVFYDRRAPSLSKTSVKISKTEEEKADKLPPSDHVSPVYNLIAPVGVPSFAVKS